jgi:thioredoxin reductase
MLDLNSIAIGVSPAYSLQVEHPTGAQYAGHLNKVAKFFKLPIREEVDVTRVTKEDGLFHLETSAGTIQTKHVIWAAGEYQYPRLNGVDGIEHCQHTSLLSSYESLEGDDFIIVGGYESGVDAAFHLAQRGKRVKLFDKGCPWNSGTADPSVALSPFSIERMRTDRFAENVELYPDTPIASVAHENGIYELTSLDGQSFTTSAQPLWAGGFAGSHKMVSNLFESREDGYPVLNEQDESTIAPGLFLVGGAVRHDDHIFCFIYKYRQRFAVVAKAIANSLGLDAEYLETYRDWGMYLDDLSCCGEECVC